MAHFNEPDRRLIEALAYQPDLPPGFNAIKGCLVWADERADGLTPEAYECLPDLWIARLIMFHDPSRQTLDDAHFHAAWQQATAERTRWPGFHRLQLSDADRGFSEECLRDGGV